MGTVMYKCYGPKYLPGACNYNGAKKRSRYFWHPTLTPLQMHIVEWMSYFSSRFLQLTQILLGRLCSGMYCMNMFGAWGTPLKGRNKMQKMLPMWEIQEDVLAFQDNKCSSPNEYQYGLCRIFIVIVIWFVTCYFSSISLDIRDIFLHKFNIKARRIFF